MGGKDTDRYNVLRGLRARRNLTQQEAAAALDVSRTVWSAWETQRTPITEEQLTKIQEVLRLEDEHIQELRSWWEQGNLPPEKD